MEIFRMIFSPIEVNTYIVTGNTGRCVVIDCGCYNDAEFTELEKLLTEKGLVPEMLINTHCHLDHIFGNLRMLEKFGLKTHCHKLEEGNRLNSVAHAELFGMSMKVPPEPAGFINDGETISAEGMTFKALHVPGHTSGSLAFYNEAEGAVFTGDALFAGSIGRTDLPGGDYETLRKSIIEKLFTLPPDTVVYPGHGNKTTIGREINTNPFFNGDRKR